MFVYRLPEPSDIVDAVRRRSRVRLSYTTKSCDTRCASRWSKRQYG
jgi:hypothetical protein